MKSTLLVLLSLNSAFAGPGCAMGRSCDCSIREDCCLGSWYNNCGCDDKNVNDTQYAGCRTSYKHGSGYTCSCEITEQGCPALMTEMGITSNAYGWTRGTSGAAYGCPCAPDDTTGKLTGTQCKHGPSAPPPPPSPPTLCVPKKGTELPKTTAADPDPVNEPCYSHSSCGKYSTGGTGGYVCCVKRGTCDNSVYGHRAVSHTADYYVGGCRGITYNAFNSSFIVADSIHGVAQTGVFADVAGESLAHAPSTVEGCAKQGECNIAYLEQIKDWNVPASSSLKGVAVSDAVMARMLAGADEPNTDAGSCRSVYPLTETMEKKFQVATTVEASGTVADYTPAVKTEMTAKLAAEMGVPLGNVEITIVAKVRRMIRMRNLATGVVITITVSYDTQAKATAGEAKMTTATGNTATMAALLSTTALPVTVTSATAPAPTAYGATPAAGGDNTGVIVGAAVGGSIGALIIVAVAFFMCKGKAAPTKGVSGSSA